MGEGAGLVDAVVVAWWCRSPASPLPPPTHTIRTLHSAPCRSKYRCLSAKGKAASLAAARVGVRKRMRAESAPRATAERARGTRNEATVSG